jgi:hypothetical protein
MEQDLKTVRGSIEFTDAAVTMDREGHAVYVRLHGFTGPVYRILTRTSDAFEKILLDNLFKSHYPPVYMQDFSQALVAAGDDAPQVDIFTLEVPGRAG